MIAATTSHHGITENIKCDLVVPIVVPPGLCPKGNKKGLFHKELNFSWNRPLIGFQFR
jgi:hypothetical protein